MGRKRERLDIPPKKRERLDDKRTESNGKVTPKLAGWNGVGRKPGATNLIPRRITEAAIAGFERHGADGKGSDGLSGFFYHLACNDLKAAAMIAARLMPQRVETSVDPQSALGQILEAARARLQYEKGRTIDSKALPAPVTRIG